MSLARVWFRIKALPFGFISEYLEEFRPHFKYLLLAEPGPCEVSTRLVASPIAWRVFEPLTSDRAGAEA